jgi:hypothetical protein
LIKIFNFDLLFDTEIFFKMLHNNTTGRNNKLKAIPYSQNILKI